MGRSWTLVYAVTAGIMGAILALLVAAVPEAGGEKDWTGQLVEGGWMAWSFPVALFFWVIALLLIVFTLIAMRWPETPRRGILRIETTRGDRLFITLLGSAFINLGWLGLGMGPQWQALIACAAWAVLVFRYV